MDVDDDHFTGHEIGGSVRELWSDQHPLLDGASARFIASDLTASGSLAFFLDLIQAGVMSSVTLLPLNNRRGESESRKPLSSFAGRTETILQSFIIDCMKSFFHPSEEASSRSEATPRTPEGLFS